MSMAKQSPWDSAAENEDEDLCPLCMEELDVSDLNFRPCPCGYRICRFCWHHIKEDLNRRCPGCRKEYDDSVIEFKPMKPEELKHLQQAKKQREKERKDLELTNRKHLANVRVKQKNQVHIQGLTTKIANEDTLAQLKTSELFSSYGRILKMFMSRRTGPTSLHTPDSRYQHVNLYINFGRNTEALACIAGLDGLTLPDGHRVKATLGSTKYCASFLRGMKCLNDNCTGAHELAEEVDSGISAAREEMSTARHAQKETENRMYSRHHPSSSNHVPPVPSGVALPATASWANKSTSNSQPASPAPHLLSLQNPLPSTKLSSSRATPVPIKPVPTASHPLPARPPQNSPHGSKSKSVAESPPPPAKPIQHFVSDAKSPPILLQPDDHTRRGPSKEKRAEPTSKLDSGPSTTSVSAPPGLQPPPGLNTLPPPPPPPGLSGTGRVSTPLPPGLVPPSSSSSSPWQATCGVTAPLESKFLPLGNLQDNKEDILSTFSPNFSISHRASIFNPSDDQFYCAPPPPLETMRYCGSFDPFGDHDIFELDLSLQDVEARQQQKMDSGDVLTGRRGSRFGFARRESGLASTTPTVGGDRRASGSPLRSIFSSQHGEPPDAGSNHHHPPQQLTRASGTRPDRAHDLLGESASTPDASVLFPGVNLAASYSANALPAALARGMKSPALQGRPSPAAPYGPGQQQSTGGAHLRDVMVGPYERSNDRLPPPFNQRNNNAGSATSPTYAHHLHHHHHHHHHQQHQHQQLGHEHVVLRGEVMRDARAGAGMFGQYSLSGNNGGSADLGTAHEFQDPAILNMRMAAAAGNNPGSSNAPTSVGYGAPQPQQQQISGSNQQQQPHDLYPGFSVGTQFHTGLGAAGSAPAGRLLPYGQQQQQGSTGAVGVGTAGSQQQQDLLGHYAFAGGIPPPPPPGGAGGRVQQGHGYYGVGVGVGVGNQGLMSGVGSQGLMNGIGSQGLMSGVGVGNQGLMGGSNVQRDSQQRHR